MQDSTADGGSVSPTENEDWSQAQNVNILVIGDELSTCKARFISTFLNNAMDRDAASENAFRKNVQCDDKQFCVNIHTNVGQESLLGACDVCMRRTDAAVFVYNIQSRESFLLFGGWRDRLHRENEHMPIALVGCSTPNEDAHAREVTAAEARKLAEACGGVFFEIGPLGHGNLTKEITECMNALLQRISSSKPGYISEKPNDDPDQQKYTELEIIVCGDVFVGKTQIIRRLLAMPFQNLYNATLGSNTHKHKAVIQDVGFILKIVDVGGLDIDTVLTRDNLMTSQGFVFVFSANSRDSFNALESIRKIVLQGKVESRIPVLLLCNKTDLVRKVSKEEGQNLAKKWGCPYFETTASQSENQSIAESFEVLIADIQHLHSMAISDAIGELDRQGYLGKEGNTFKSLNRRYFTLKDCTLSWSNDINQAIKGSVPLNDSSASAEILVDPKNKEGFPFVVTAGDERMVLLAANEAERDAWVASIKANIGMADVAGSMLDEVIKAMLWESCSKMSEVVRRRINTDEPSTPPKSPMQSSASTPTMRDSGNLVNVIGAGLGLGLGSSRDGEGEDFMAPIAMHDISSSSPNASPPVPRGSSSPALYKSKSFFRSSSKEKK